MFSLKTPPSEMMMALEFHQAPSSPALSFCFETPTIHPFTQSNWCASEICHQSWNPSVWSESSKALIRTPPSPLPHVKHQKHPQFQIWRRSGLPFQVQPLTRGFWNVGPLQPGVTPLQPGLTLLQPDVTPLQQDVTLLQRGVTPLQIKTTPSAKASHPAGHSTLLLYWLCLLFVWWR